eukprot:UN07169
MNNKDQLGNLRCRDCNLTAAYSINKLDRPVDVYYKWIDQSHDLNYNTDNADGDDYVDDVGVYDSRDELSGVRERVTSYADDDDDGDDIDLSRDRYSDDDEEVRFRLL